MVTWSDRSSSSPWGRLFEGLEIMVECLLSRKQPFARGVSEAISTSAYGRKQTFDEC